MAVSTSVQRIEGFGGRVLTPADPGYDRRLRAVKRAYDPGNVFRLNQNIALE